MVDASVWPLGGLGSYNAKTPLGASEPKWKQQCRFWKESLLGLYFFRSCAFFFHHFCKLLIQLSFSIMCECFLIQGKGCWASHCCQAQDRYAQDWKKSGLSRIPQLACKLQKNGKNRCTMKCQWIKGALKKTIYQLYFLGNSWVKEVSFSSLLFENPKGSDIIGPQPFF